MTTGRAQLDAEAIRLAEIAGACAPEPTDEQVARVRAALPPVEDVQSLGDIEAVREASRAAAQRGRRGRAA